MPNTPDRLKKYSRGIRVSLAALAAFGTVGCGKVEEATNRLSPEAFIVEARIDPTNPNEYDVIVKYAGTVSTPLDEQQEELKKFTKKLLDQACGYGRIVSAQPQIVYGVGGNCKKGIPYNTLGN